MKIFKRIIIGLESLCLIGIVICFIMFCFPKKRGVDNILSFLDLNIPKYETIYKKEVWDNCYEYKITFPKSDSASIRRQVENIKKNDGLLKNGFLYNYEFDGKSYNILYSTREEIDPGDNYYVAHITPQEGTAELEKSFEFGEQMWYVFLIIGILFIGLAIGAIYVITLLVVYLVNRFKTRNKVQKAVDKNTPFTKEELINQLKALAKSKCPDAEHMGAMCYCPSLPKNIVHVKCESCGKEFSIPKFDSELDDDQKIRTAVKTIGELGYDVKLEYLCGVCANKYGLTDFDGDPLNVGRMYYVFFFKAKDQKEYNVWASNSIGDYEAVLAFLKKENVYYTDEEGHHDSHPVCDEDGLEVIKHMTGISIGK